MELITAKMADFISGLKYENIPSDIRWTAKERILDILAASLAGSVQWEQNSRIIKSFDDMDFAGGSTIFGRCEKCSYVGAAAINSAYAHSVELDDGHKNAGMHAGAVIVPSSLSIGEKLHMDGRTVITAVIAGYEIAYRFAGNMCPALITKGFHPSAVCGSMGVVAVSSVLMGLDCRQCANALALVPLFASGLMEVTRSGQSSKGAMVGHAVIAGIIASTLAKNNFMGPDGSFNGSGGILKLMSENVDARRIIEGLGSSYLIKDTYVKLYPTCRHTHAPIEAMLALRKEYNLIPDEVERIEVGTFPIAYDLTGASGHPVNAQKARFSTPYCIAVALLKGTFGAVDLEDNNINQKELEKIDKLVSVYVDDEITAEFPKKRGAKVKVFLKNGTVVEKTLYELKGSPDMPVSLEEIKLKFDDFAGTVFDGKRKEFIYAKLLKLEDIEDIASFTSLLAQ